VVDENGWREMRADATREAVQTETDSDSEAPYLRMRTGEASGLRTPTPLLDDLTDLAIPMPEPPATPPLPLMEVIAGAHLDPADETGVTLLAPEVRSRRVSLSRPWFASLGVLAFSAGLLTAAAAGVIARPVRVAAAANSVVATEPPSTGASAAAAPATNPVVAAPPAEAVEAPLAVAAAEPSAAGPGDAVETTQAALSTLPARPVPGAKSAAAGNAGAKLRTRGNGAPARGRTRTTKSRPEPHGESAIAQDAAGEATTAPTESKAAAPAAAARHQPDWVDPFAE
jgi:hypothetical protein